jgi:hypothetical protein
MQDSRPPDRPRDARDSADGGSPTLRVVVLTNGSPTGVRVLASLAERGIGLAGVTVEARIRVRDCYRATTLLPRIVETPLAIARSIRRRMRLRRSLRYVTGHAPIAIVPDRGSEEATRRLKALRPDLLVLAGVGIVTPDILAIAPLGTVNGHPALLPWARGNGVVAHSILRGVAIGAACHRVDAGIDTGPVLAQRLLQVTGDDTLELLETRAVELAAELLADVVTAAVARGVLPPGEPQRERFPLCRWGDHELRAAVARQLADGAASALFRRWKNCAAGDGLDLPAHIPADCVPVLTMPASSTGAREPLATDRC